MFAGDVDPRSDPTPQALAEAAAGQLRGALVARDQRRAVKDFYVEYELRACLERTEDWFNVQSELNSRIQDAFNEFGVQIMSPHFMVQPGAAVVVPKERWNAAPAKD